MGFLLQKNVKWVANEKILPNALFSVELVHKFHQNFLLHFDAFEICESSSCKIGRCRVGDLFSETLIFRRAIDGKLMKIEHRPFANLGR